MRENEIFLVRFAKSSTYRNSHTNFHQAESHSDIGRHGDRDHTSRMDLPEPWHPDTCRSPLQSGAHHTESKPHDRALCSGHAFSAWKPHCTGGLSSAIF